MPAAKPSEDMTLVEIIQKYSDEDTARAFLENMRWPNGPVCAHCNSKNVTRLRRDANADTPGRKGLLKCRDCRKQFTVMVNTIFSDSHIPLTKWVIAIHLLCASKKGMSAHQIHRMLGITYKSAWFLMHRIRWAMTQEPLHGMLSGVVEVDETYVGGREKGKRGIPGVDSKKTPVVAMVERTTPDKKGRVRSFVVDRVTVDNIKPVLEAHIEKAANLQTDENIVYHFMKSSFPQHDTIKHKAKEYVRKEANGKKVTTNTVEGFFSIIKRGVHGTYHHWSKKYMGMYLAEFDFRYNSRGESDGNRTILAIKAVEGKRLMLREPKNKKQSEQPA